MNQTQDLQTIPVDGAAQHFQFSSVKPDDLEATEYTLVTGIVDITGSVYPFTDLLLKMVQNVFEACKKSPRSDYLLLRALEFNTQVNEIHGFLPLESISPYQPFDVGGMTALFDAAENGIRATAKYGKQLAQNDYTVNGIVYIITDGEDNSSRASASNVRNAIEEIMKEEELDSILTILVGINAQDCLPALEAFKNDANLDQFIDTGTASDKTLAKVADFISRSISSTSQSLGSGQSQSVAF